MSGSGRVIIVSNRLPVTVSTVDGVLRATPSAGGLATGLRRHHEQSGGLWIGWPGYADLLGGVPSVELDRLLAPLGAVPVPLSREEISQYYEGVSNGVLWPLFHYLLDQLPLRVEHWDAYVAANARLADVIAEHYRPGDVVWVHDYQLMLVPAMLRERVPDARIGFFLHIPFPSTEIFSALPQRAELLRGVLGADLVGFHTASYTRHFVHAVERILGTRPDSRDEPTSIQHALGRTRVGVFPMGVDAADFAARAGSDAVEEVLARLRPTADEALIVGVDRLDYTKGIPRRLIAFEQLLERHPELHERVRLVQVAVPSRGGVRAYQLIRRSVEGLVGRINGMFGTARWSPIHYLHRSVTDAELLALYRAATVMLVTPLRDGMNLVAKEFVACREDEDGVLVLSEFVGAAAELADAVQVNPWDVDGSAEAYYRALTMPRTERRTRMRAMRQRVQAYDIHAWSAEFLDTLRA